jgi:hypothetical protein
LGAFEPSLDPAILVLDDTAARAHNPGESQFLVKQGVTVLDLPIYPGLPTFEPPGPAHLITAAPTSIAVFAGYTHPQKTQQFGRPVELFSFADYERAFGGFFRSVVFDAEIMAPPFGKGLFGDLAQAVSQFFANGGTHA